jgi:hypothetical protein
MRITVSDIPTNLRPVEPVESAKVDETFPPTSTAHLIRRGIFSCSSYAGCSFVFFIRLQPLRA